jgi:hypothetical protein
LEIANTKQTPSAKIKKVIRMQGAELKSLSSSAFKIAFSATRMFQ